MKAVYVIENESEENQDNDKSQGCGHDSVDCQLPIADFICALAEKRLEIGNWQATIGNELSVLNDHALNNVRDVLATIDRRF